MRKTAGLSWVGGLCLLAGGLFPPSVLATDTAAQLILTNGAAKLELPALPATDAYRIWSTPDLNAGFGVNSGGALSGFSWSGPAGLGNQFFLVENVVVESNRLAVANLLNRIAYGPTPDELPRALALGPAGYIEEQLAPELISEALPIDRTVDRNNWNYVQVTGTATATTFYIYQTVVGDVYLDDLQLVRGAVAGVGANLIQNGGFDAPLAGTWTVSTNLSASELSSTVKRSGASSLHLVSSSPGNSRASSIWQDPPGVTVGQVYTLSYWFKPGTNAVSGLELRFSGSGLVAAADSPRSRLEGTIAKLDDLRAYHVQRAIQSRKQLLETLLQFFENHFVTQNRKSREYLDRYYSATAGDGDLMDYLAAEFEFKELERWRAALSKPQCTFHDLLKLSAESVAMIIYLDTVDSKGNGSNIANENYARELLELFTFGVDNGYDQNDIVETSKAWTGWSVNIVDRDKEFNPFVGRTVLRKPGATNSEVRNLDGVWTFNYKLANHNNSAKVIFPGKTVPARFGAPWAGRSYQLNLPARSGTNSIKDGYEVVAHLANQPFTQEYLAVKLCRLLVHEHFEHGVYDYTAPNLSPEAKLIRDCMLAWEGGSPKGQLRDVLRVILNSELFRTVGSASHKVRTPLEFTVAAVRALRAAAGDGAFTADTDGYGLKDAHYRMGSMRLFDREEPNGYSEYAAGWISAGSLAERLRFIQSFLMAPGQSGKSDGGNSNVSDPVKLLKLKLPSTAWNDAGAVVDYFLSILFPAEGRANLAYYRESAILFLNTADNGTTSQPLQSLPNTSMTYDTRIRGMVAMLMASQRFQEQ